MSFGPGCPPPPFKQRGMYVCMKQYAIGICPHFAAFIVSIFRRRVAPGHLGELRWVRNSPEGSRRFLAAFLSPYLSFLLCDSITPEHVHVPTTPCIPLTDCAVYRYTQTTLRIYMLVWDCWVSSHRLRYDTSPPAIQKQH